MLFYIMPPMLCLSVMFSISSYSWLTIWMGMEINLIIFLMMNIKSKNLFTTESSMKYFLIQSLGSIILLISLSLNNLICEEWLLMYMYSIPLAMMLKSGLAPFHSWSPPVISKMSYFNIFLFITVQKIIPLMICFCSWINIMMVSSILNVIIGSIGGLSTSSLTKILIFSSINNTGWMIMSLAESYFLFFLFMMSYMIISFMLIMTLYLEKIKWIIQIKMMSLSKKMSLYSMMMSMSGLPPFLGFFPKWLIINSMFTNMLLMTSVFIITSVVTMFFYMKMSMSSMFMKMLSLKTLTNSFSLNINMLLNVNLLGIFLFYLLT